MDDDAAERAVVFDNLIAPELPAYAQYLGLARLRARHGWTYAELSERTGLSATLIGDFFIFERLPRKTLERIAAFPEAFSASRLQVLSAHIQKNPDGIDTAVQAVVEGCMTAKEAVGRLTKAAQTQVVEQASPICVGRAKYADITRRRNQVSIAFSCEDEAAEVFALVEELLRKRSSE